MTSTNKQMANGATQHHRTLARRDRIVKHNKSVLTIAQQDGDNDLIAFIHILVKSFILFFE